MLIPVCTGLPICAFEQGTICLPLLSFVSATSALSSHETLFILYHLWSVCVCVFVNLAVGSAFQAPCVKCSGVALSQQSSCAAFSQKPEESQRQSNTIKSPLSLFNSRQFLSLMSLHCFILSASIISDFGHIPVVHSHRPCLQCLHVCVWCVCFQFLAGFQRNSCVCVFLCLSRDTNINHVITVVLFLSLYYPSYLSEPQWLCVDSISSSH